mgnify:FL=1
MLIVKQDKTRKEEEGQIFVELTIYRDVRNIADCNSDIGATKRICRTSSWNARNVLRKTN